MVKRTPLVPKGSAMALHLSPEYKEGQEARKNGTSNSENPYKFFSGDYTKNYAWDMGWQEPFRVHVGE